MAIIEECIAVGIVWYCNVNKMIIELRVRYRSNLFKCVSVGNVVLIYLFKVSERI